MEPGAAGYQCEAVNDDCAAADKIEQNDYDLVLLDIMLPGLTAMGCWSICGPWDACHFITAIGTYGTGCAG